MADARTGKVIGFYDTHPISEAQILDKLRAEGADLDHLTEDVLQAHDQDHYGGLAANDILAARAGIEADAAVLDICCGLGGPARYLAQNLGCQVTGLDLTESRVAGARRLTAMCGLEGRVDFTCGNALDLPFEDKGFDVVIAQEAFCHIPDKDRLIYEATRVLKPGGRIVFTDILATNATTPETRNRLTREMTFNDLSTAKEYEDRLHANTCEVLRTEDLSPEWEKILVDRLAMYRGLRDQTVARLGQDRFDEWDAAYSFFVGCYASGQLGGGRFLARRLDA